MWPGIPDPYQNLPESHSGSFRYTRSRDYQTPTRHALLGHRKRTSTFKLFRPIVYLKRVKHRHFKFGIHIEGGEYVLAYTWQITPVKAKGVCSGSRDLIFSQMSDNLSERVQDTDIVIMEDQQEIIRDLSNGTTTNDLDWPWRSPQPSETLLNLIL